jgi:hypothetical protein
MRNDPLYLLWSINCRSSEDCHRLVQWIPNQIAPDAVIVREIRNLSETVFHESLRLGDYFEDIQVLPSTNDTATSFRLLFQRRATAGRFWKDLMVGILHRIHDEAAESTNTLEYRGDEEPKVMEAAK